MAIMIKSLPSEEGSHNVKGNHHVEHVTNDQGYPWKKDEDHLKLTSKEP